LGFWGRPTRLGAQDGGVTTPCALGPRDGKCIRWRPILRYEMRFVFAVGAEIPTIGASSSLPPSPPGMKMMHRPVAGANDEPVGGGDRGADIGLGLTDRVCEREAAGESRRDRRG
jgi:hypothetical protein